MPYRLKQDEKVEESIRRIAGEQVDRAIASADEAIEKGGDADEAVHEVRRLIEKAHDLIAGFGLGQGCFDSFDSLQGGLKKAYRRARKRMREALAEPETARFHEWRKRAKYHRYHVRLLSRAFYPLLDRRREQIHLLTDHLGDEHDLAVLEETLDELVRSTPTDEENALEPCRKLIERRRTELRALAGPLGQKLFAEKPKHFVRRVEAYWEVWREGPPVLPEPIETLF